MTVKETDGEAGAGTDDGTGEGADSQTTLVARDGDAFTVGIVGLGNIGHFHAKNLTDLSEDLDATLAGGMDVDPEARQQFAGEFGTPVFESVETLYHRVDAVVITTPNRFHEEYAVGALKAGCHVLVEKPVAHTVESAQRVVEAAAESDSICMVGFHNRFAHPVQVLAAQIEEGRLGDVGHVEARYVRRRGIPARGTWFTDRAVAGGGALIDIGAHTIDLALYLAGFPTVEEVSGVTRSEFGTRADYASLDRWGNATGTDFDVDDSASAFLRCADGTTVSLEVAWAANREPSQEVIIRGDEAGATLDFDAGELVVHETANSGAAHFADTHVTTDMPDPHIEELRGFLKGARTGQQPALNTPAQGLAVQRVIDAIYHSSETGRAVDPTGHTVGPGAD